LIVSVTGVQTCALPILDLRDWDRKITWYRGLFEELGFVWPEKVEILRGGFGVGMMIQQRAVLFDMFDLVLM
jgi:hypothetical protein